jgi:dihydroxyacetone kinase-like protein
MEPVSAPALDWERALAWLRAFGRLLHEHKDYLTQLDAAIGDADHGINMERGFAAVREKLEAAQPVDLGALFMLTGSTLVSTVGGASGPLYGTAFLRLGSALSGKSTASLSDLATALEAAYDGVAMRGKSHRGEKTLLDAFGPALDALQAAAATGCSFAESVSAAADAAAAGARATIPLIATKGRASFLGEKSAGHQDPGATSTMLLFQALARSAGGRAEP